MGSQQRLVLAAQMARIPSKQLSDDNVLRSLLRQRIYKQKAPPLSPGTCPTATATAQHASNLLLQPRAAGKKLSSTLNGARCAASSGHDTLLQAAGHHGAAGRCTPGTASHANIAG